MKELKRVSIKIIGDVQQVGFRFFVRQLAEENSVKGLVKNEQDGSLEIIAEGAQTQLDSFVDSVCAGPPTAIISGCETSYGNATDEFLGFEIM
ncbi:MAG: acylphosphatase [bacterium]|nr:acylphosphatase [bacterium]